MKPLTRLHSCRRGTMSAPLRRSGTIRSLHRRKLGDVLAARGLGGLDRHRLERDLRADRQPRSAGRSAEITVAIFGIAAGGLAVGEQHDRLAVARHLDRARRDAVGGDVEAAAVPDARGR